MLAQASAWWPSARTLRVRAAFRSGFPHGRLQRRLCERRQLAIWLRFMIFMDRLLSPGPLVGGPAAPLSPYKGNLAQISPSVYVTTLRLKPVSKRLTRNFPPTFTFPSANQLFDAIHIPESAACTGSPSLRASVLECAGPPALSRARNAIKLGKPSFAPSPPSNRSVPKPIRPTSLSNSVSRNEKSSVQERHLPSRLVFSGPYAFRASVLECASPPALSRARNAIKLEKTVIRATGHTRPAEIAWREQRCFRYGFG